MFSDALSATLEGKAEGQGLLRFNLTGDDFDAALAQAGAMPLPPYIAAKRQADAQDKDDYQTDLGASCGGGCSAHGLAAFRCTVAGGVRRKGVSLSYVTLHVGAGTFLPVKVEDVTTHKMHAEWGEVSAEAASEIARDQGRRAAG